MMVTCRTNRNSYRERFIEMNHVEPIKNDLINYFAGNDVVDADRS